MFAKLSSKLNIGRANEVDAATYCLGMLPRRILLLPLLFSSKPHTI
jgi:hypothetical protein